MNRRLARALRYVPIMLILTAVFVVMVERVHPIAIAGGVLAAAGAIVVTNSALRIDYSTVFLDPVSLARYLLMLVREMAIASAGMVRIILTGRAKESEFVYEAALEHELALFLLANTIILTPGSVAVRRKGQRISVVTADDAARARRGVERLERSIAKLRMPPDGPAAGEGAER